MNWHFLSIEELYELVGSSRNGISSQEAEVRFTMNGPNELEKKKKTSPIVLFLNQFKDFMILILIIAAVVSGIIGDTIDASIILIIVILNAGIGFVQEYRAGKAIEALKKMTTFESDVLRDGKVVKIPSSEIVVGDIVFLEAGNSIPADMRLIEAYNLMIDESPLTGESFSVIKTNQEIFEENIPVADKVNMAFKGTLAINGRGVALVVATGMNTELGKIANLLQNEEPKTPLQLRLADFSRKLSYIILIICLMLFLVGLIRGEDPMEMLLLAISLAVAAIPEALPALATIALSLGAKRLAKQKALIRSLPAVETLGSVTYICSDKTGTLTQNKMTVVQVNEKNEQEFFIQNISPLYLIMILNHEVKTTHDKSLIGDPTEIALVEYINKNFESDIIIKAISDLPRVHELPFDSHRKCMTSVHRYKEKYILLSKGAVENIFHNLSEKEKSNNLLLINDEWSQMGLRVLAFAYKVLDELPDELSSENLEKDLMFSGMVGMIDPPRDEAKSSIRECKTAGIIPVMITGDHPKTAATIAKEIGILDDNGLVVTGMQLQSMTSIEFENKVEKIRVYARVNPEQKLNIIKALQHKKHFVAMTGDGVNDAPSLKAANIGVAMGINGTDVSKEVAHMILLDDNFATIVRAVKEGRRIYDNIRKFVKYIMTTNAAEVLIITLAPLFGLPIPLLPVQILWINLISDGLPALALANEKAEIDVMQRPPRKTNESLFAGGTALHICVVALLMTGLTIGLQVWAVSRNIDHWQTMVFVILSLSQLGHVLAIRSERTFLFKQGLQTNLSLLIIVMVTFVLQILVVQLGIGNQVLKTQPLNIVEWLLCIGIASIVFHFVEFEKFVKQMKNKNVSL